MPAQRNQRTTRSATTRTGSTTVRRPNGNGNGRRNNRANWHDTIAEIAGRTHR